MSNIEEMEKLQAKSKFYLIPAKSEDGPQANLEMFPLGVDDMGLLSSKEDMDMKEMADNAKALMAVSLRIPKDKVVLDIKFMEEVMNAIMNLNGFDKEDMEKSGIKNFIDKKKEQNESNKQA